MLNKQYEYGFSSQTYIYTSIYSTISHVEFSKSFICFFRFWFTCFANILRKGVNQDAGYPGCEELKPRKQLKLTYLHAWFDVVVVLKCQTVRQALEMPMGTMPTN